MTVGPARTPHREPLCCRVDPCYLSDPSLWYRAFCSFCCDQLCTSSSPGAVMLTIGIRHHFAACLHHQECADMLSVVVLSGKCKVCWRSCITCIPCTHSLQCFAASLGLLSAIPQCLMSCNLAVVCRFATHGVKDNREQEMLILRKACPHILLDSLSIFLVLNVMSCRVLFSVITKGKLKGMHHGLCIHHVQTRVQSLTLKTDAVSGCVVFWLLLTCDCNAFRQGMRYRAGSMHLFSGATACSRRENSCSRRSFPARADVTRSQFGPLSAWGHSLSTV